MRQTRELEIETSRGSATISARPLDAGSAIKLSGWISKRLGPAMKDIRPDANVMELVAGVFQNLQDGDLESLTKELLKGSGVSAVVDGERLDVDYKCFCELFRGYIGESFKLLTFLLGVTFGNFGSALSGLGQAWAAAKGN